MLMIYVLMRTVTWILILRMQSALEYPKDDITSYPKAIDYVLSGLQIDESARNIIMAHQFVTGATRSDSEEISVGRSR